MRFLILPIVFCLLIACAGPQGLKPNAKIEDVIAKQESEKGKSDEMNRMIFSSVKSAPQYQDYIISEGDLIAVSVFQAPELNTEARVSARGQIVLPLLGSVSVKGLTARELEQRIEGLYRAKYLRDPHVTVFLKEQFAAKVTVLGSVVKPGTYDYPARQRLLDVLAMAGGLSEKAGTLIQVRRAVVDKESLPEVLFIDLEELVKRGRDELNIPIGGGDVIFVPEAGVVYVDGAVRKPGVYPIKGRMTLHEAIIAAGGFSTVADESSIKLIREDEGSKREVVSLTLQDIQNGKAKELVVKDRDVVFVETSKMEALLYGLRLNLGMGLFGIGYTPPPQ